MASLSIDQWLVCLALAGGLLLVDEAIKYGLRRQRRAGAEQRAAVGVK